MSEAALPRNAVASVGNCRLAPVAVGVGCAEPARSGLSVRGRRLVERLAGLGMILDLAHSSEQTFAETLMTDLSTRVTQEGKKGKTIGSVLFAVMDLGSGDGPVRPTLIALHDDEFKDAVGHCISVPGYSILTSTNIANVGGMFVILKPFDERKGKPDCL